MATIKSGKWLKETLAQKNMTQKELAAKTGLSVPAIAKIISGERYGSPKTWEKITMVLGDKLKLSVDSDDFIDELKEEIELYGKDQQ